MKKAVKDEFLGVLEQGVRDVLSAENSTTEQKIQAINTGAKLMQIKHKIGELAPGKEKPDNFFEK